MHAAGIESVVPHLSFRALGGDLLPVEDERDSGGIAHAHADLTRCANGGMGGRNESFLGYQLAVCGCGDPGVLGGLDNKRKSRRRLLRRL